MKSHISSPSSWCVALVFVGSISTPLLALASDDPVAAARSWRESHEAEIVHELAELARIPNHASDAPNIRRNAEHLVGLLEQRGIQTRLLEVEGAPPAVFGELASGSADAPTIVIYAHYDGQPVDPTQWSSDPFTPLLRDAPVESGGRELSWDAVTPPYGPEWRLYARAISDDRAPIIAVLVALDALAAAGIEPSVNLKFFLEGEEEVGSPHLEATLHTHRELLDADLWLFCDGPIHQSRSQQVLFGVRGMMGLEATVYGPARALHSGHYGNWAPNPAAVLSNLIASMRDSEGRIKIEGFYDDVRPLTEADRAALAMVPNVDDQLRGDLALAETEADNASLAERILQPALNVQGLRAGNVGELTRNAVPTEASATFDFRMVPDQTPERVRQRVEAHLEREGYTITHEEPDLEARGRSPKLVWLNWKDGYRALRTPLDDPTSRAVLEVLDEALPEPPLRLPILGGSLPLYLFDEVLDTPVIVVPIVNHDNNQHAPDENLRLQNLWDGTEVYAALIAKLGDHWD